MCMLYLCDNNSCACVMCVYDLCDNLNVCMIMCVCTCV